MQRKLLATAAFIGAAAMVPQARAGTISFNFSGAGILAQIQLTYSPTSPQGPLDHQPNTNYPVGSFIVTGITGTFSDSNLSTPIVDAPIKDMAALTYATARDPGNILAPHSLSFLSSGLSYDNLLYLHADAPPVATGYPPFGGFFDIYGLAFDLTGSTDVVNLWNDGTPSGTGTNNSYGVAVADGAAVIDRVGGVSVPEPGSFLLFGSGLLGILAWRQRSRA